MIATIVLFIAIVAWIAYAILVDPQGYSPLTDQRRAELAKALAEHRKKKRQRRERRQ